MARSPRWERNRLLKCDCGGYAFPHRKSGGTCYTSKTREITAAKRRGDQEALLELRLAGVGGKVYQPDEPCPF